jgi:branched-chain amino acid transport system substrate-binding protein
MRYWSAKGVTRIGLVYTTDASGRTGEQAVKAALGAVPGMSLAAEQSYAPDALDVTPQLQQVMAARPQALVVWSTGTPAGVAFKAIQQLGVRVPVATTNGNLANAFLRRIADFQPETLLIPATTDFWWPRLPASSAQHRAEDAYHRAYQQRFGSSPDFGPGVAYDVIHLLAEALRTSGAKPAALRSSLERERGVVGVVGTYHFSPTDHRGLTIADVDIMMVRNGGFVLAP